PHRKGAVRRGLRRGLRGHAATRARRVQARALHRLRARDAARGRCTAHPGLSSRRRPRTRPRRGPLSTTVPRSVPAATFVQAYADAALEACWLIVLALLPLYVDLLRSQTSVPRSMFLQVIAALMALLWLVQWLAARRLPAAEGAAVAGRMAISW